MGTDLRMSAEPESTCCIHVSPSLTPTRALFSKKSHPPGANGSSLLQSGDSLPSPRRVVSPAYTLSEGQLELQCAPTCGHALRPPAPERTDYTVSYVTADMAAYSGSYAPDPPWETQCNCPSGAPHGGPEQVFPDAASDLRVATATINTGSGGGGGGNTLVSIPIPVSVPLPLSQSSGASSGPIVITSPPPPAPPNPPQPPQPSVPRPGIAQDVASMLMMLVMDRVRERVEGTPVPVPNEGRNRDVEMAAAAAAAAAEAVARVQPKENMVPMSVVQQMLRERKESTAFERKERRLRRKSLAAVLAQPVTPLQPAIQPPPLVLPFSTPEPATEAPELPILLPPPTNIAPSSQPLSPSPEDKTPSGTFRAPVPCCDRFCCCSLVLVMLSCVLAINLAFLIAPNQVTAFLCELGLEEPKVAKEVSTKSARLEVDAAGNDSEAPAVRKRFRLGVRAGGESVFAIEEPLLEEPPLPTGDIFGTDEPAKAATVAGQTPQPDFEDTSRATWKHCPSGRCYTTTAEEETWEKEIARQEPQLAASTSYMYEDNAFRDAWYALGSPYKAPEASEEAGSFLDKSLLIYLHARRTTLLATSKSTIPAPEFGLLLGRVAMTEKRYKATTTRRRRQHDKLGALVAAAPIAALYLVPSKDVKRQPKVGKTSFTAPLKSTTLFGSILRLSKDPVTSVWVRALVLPTVSTRAPLPF